MKSFYTLVIGFFITASGLFAQSVPDTILFEDFEGEDLIAQLMANFVPRRVLTYGGARDVIYGSIYNVKDSIYCVYSGHAVYLEPGTDPSTFVFMNGSDNGITAEHTWPRSKGADTGDAFSDMHHLFPTRARVNEVRGNSPFAEIDDDETDFWYYRTLQERNKPTENIDLYSEFKFGLFEPREDHKGNVARAMFHFYTFYKSQADAADPDFFEEQRATLCDWHYLDPVDSTEYARTNRIAFFQDQKANPFVLDCSLAKRLYCQDTEEDCVGLSVNTKEIVKPLISEIKIIPNPNKGESMVTFNLDENAKVELIVYNMLGQIVGGKATQEMAPGEYQWDLKINRAGLYNCLLSVNKDGALSQFPIKVLVR